MLEVAVYNPSGEKVDTLQVDEQDFGGQVNVDLVKQAVVTYHANRRQGSSATRSRGMVQGSTRKLFRQKGTGNARRGTVRTVVMRGGGVAFAKRQRCFRKRFPQKMRWAALNSALLAKMLGQDLLVLDGLALAAPKTSELARVLKNLQINRTCLLALHGRDANVYLSSRNIADLTVRVTEELNAFDVAIRQKMIVTREGFDALLAARSAKESQA
jgi:large subunit ribosomal protein L4